MVISTQLPVTRACCSQPADTPSLVMASQTQSAAISTSRSMDLNLVTEEGDKVTLSWDARAAALYTRSASVSAGEDGDYLYRQSELAAGQYQVDLRWSVEGDLNAAERREIQKVIKTLNKMMHQLTSGDMQPEAATARKLSGLETIASLDAHLSYERQVLVARQAETAVVYDSTGGLSNTSTDIAAPAFSNRPAKPRADVMADRMARHFKRAKAPWAHKMQAVEQLFETHRKRAATWAKNTQTSNIFDYLRERFHDALEGAAENTGE